MFQLVCSFKQFFDGNAKDFGEKGNLCIGGGKAECFDISENFWGDITPYQLKFGSHLFLCPTPLTAEFGNILSETIVFMLHGNAQPTAHSNICEARMRTNFKIDASSSEDLRTWLSKSNMA
jgi:hypothetical protein